MKFANGSPVVPAANDGPVPALMAGELTLARSGALDTDLLSQQPFYGTNFTKPLLFIEDGAYFSDQAQAMGLTGSQWGVMNETGSYPGQPWLWLYTLWYQVPGWTNSANIDMIAVYMTGLGDHPAAGHPVHPRPARHPALDPAAPADLAHSAWWHSHRGRGIPAGRGTPASREGAHQLGAVNRVPGRLSSGDRARSHPGHLSERRGLPLTVDTRCRHLSLPC